MGETMAKKLALGKGIASLIKETPNEILKASLAAANFDSADEAKKEAGAVERAAANSVLMVNCDSIQQNPGQPRKMFKEAELEELANSIKENGVLQPIIVKSLEGGKFQLIAGERRLRASKKAGLTQIPVIVRQTTEKQQKVLAIIENIQRSDLNCVETAYAFYQIINDYKLTQEELAKTIGKERSSVANHLRLLKLPREVLEFLQKDLLSFGHGKILAGIEDKLLAKELASEVVEKKLSVRQLEEMITKKLDAPKFAKNSDSEFKEKEAQLRKNLEQHSGLHIQVKLGSRGDGKVVIKFNNQEEFDKIVNIITH